MADLQLKMVEPVFRTQHRVIYGDTDAGGVVYNANFLRFFEIGRSEMMRSMAIPYSEMEKLGMILPVTETYLRYKAPALYDDLITIATSLVEIKKVSCRFHYRVTCLRAEREQLLVKGFTNHACINRQGKLMPFPEEVHERISSIGQGDNC
jgi:acyl-CoA thioester hydrolase